MYLGRIVEEGETGALFTSPAHPYTRSLLASVPELVLDAEELVRFVPIEGEIPSPHAPPPGCHFHPRCPFAQDRCRSDAPPLAPMADGRLVACHFAERVRAAPPAV